ncbi:hypothetical protein BASA81_003564 [Batrachochytrium salamandrivorans]|nr:hypothetical protein BASA81_003564 [Batrachochytrium salamandrivorans]
MLLSRLARRRLAASVPSTTKQEAKMYLQFECTNAECEQPTGADRVVKKFISKLAYQEGVVLTEAWTWSRLRRKRASICKRLVARTGRRLPS